MAIKEHVPNAIDAEGIPENKDRANVGRIILLVIGDAIAFCYWPTKSWRSREY